MKQASVDKYNIAWFKIAECVSRGEREKALGVYRLLSHSIDDSALVKQLEGDILLSFNDSNAVEKYCQAVELYKKSGKVLQAAAICEHIVTLEPTVWHHKINIISLYAQLKMQDKVENHIKYAAQQLLHDDNNKHSQLFLADLKEINPEGYVFAQEYLKK